MIIVGGNQSGNYSLLFQTTKTEWCKMIFEMKWHPLSVNEIDVSFTHCHLNEQNYSVKFDDPRLKFSRVRGLHWFTVGNIDNFWLIKKIQILKRPKNIFVELQNS